MAAEPKDTTVLQSRDSGVLTLTLNRPERLNALTGELLDELTRLLRAAADDDDVRAVILTGAGRAFCSGLDLKEAAASAGSLNVRQELGEHYTPALRAIRELRKPVIAAVNGPAAGAGFSLAIATDLRIAAESASFVMAFVRIGLVPDAGATYLLPRLIGPARAAEMMMLGEPVGAERAMEIGLLNRVVADALLTEAAQSMAARLATGPRSLGLIKEALAHSPDNDLEAQLAVEERLQEAATTTQDFYEGIGAFLQKRKPVFTGH